MADLLRGPLRVLGFSQSSGAGGDTVAYLRPPQGEIWDLYMARGSHDGAAGLQCDWYFVDSIGPMQVTMGGGTAQPRLLNTDTGNHYPLRLRYGCYIAFQVLGMAASKTVTVYAVLERIKGITTQGA